MFEDDKNDIDQPHNPRELGHKIMVVRKSLKMTNAEVAQKVGLPKGHLWQIEAGERPVPSATLLKIADALGVNAIRFFQSNPLEPTS